VASASPAQAPATPSVTSTAGSVPSGADVYLAESQDVRGTTAHAPGCQAGCPLSGDGTTVLWDMSWPTWTGGQAVGTGTEKIDGCDPNCAAGPEYPVTVTVTFSQPAGDRALGEWFWTYATFTWPNGLPPALTGASAPSNPRGLHPGQSRSHPVLRLTARSACVLPGLRCQVPAIGTGQYPNTPPSHDRGDVLSLTLGGPAVTCLCAVRMGGVRHIGRNRPV
jgi:hypothetical protein